MQTSGLAKNAQHTGYFDKNIQLSSELATLSDVKSVKLAERR